jgi:ParB family transcriptional regulator, chromosome partitioning protein
MPTPDHASAPRSLPLTLLRHSLVSPRAKFNPKSLEALAQHLRQQNGPLEPLTVRPLLEGGREVYEVVCGERRFRAAEIARLTALPCLVKSLSDNDARRLALVDQLQRERLTDLEEIEAIGQLLEFELHLDADGVRRVLNKMHFVMQRDGNLELIFTGEEGGANLAEHAETVVNVFADIGHGTWQSYLTNSMRLLQLPEDVLEGLRDGVLSSKTAAKQLARVRCPSARAQLMTAALTGRWSTRRLELEVDTTLGETHLERRYAERLRDLARHLERQGDTALTDRVQRLIADLETELARPLVGRCLASEHERDDHPHANLQSHSRAEQPRSGRAANHRALEHGVGSRQPRPAG